MSQSADGEVQRAGLKQTLNHVKTRSPYYETYLSDTHVDEDNAFSVLECLPVHDAASWASARSAMRTERLSIPLEIGFTGGTTATPKPFVISAGEREARTALLATTPAAPDQYCLTLYSTAHGFPASTGVGANEVSLPLETSDQLRQVVALLQRADAPYDELPTITRMAVSLRKLKFLTMELLALGIRPEQLDIREISVYGVLLSKPWRSWLEKTWRASIHDTYSCSEVSIASAAQCGRCGLFHFPPWVVVEVLRKDSDFGQPGFSQARAGLLVLTTLYPFVQVEPRIRYSPGDVVEVDERECPLTGSAGIRLLGRHRHMGTRALDERRYTDIGRIVDALDTMPWVNRRISSPFATHAHADSLAECGGPRFAVSTDGDGRFQLDVEANLPVPLWPEYAEAGRQAIRVALGDQISDVRVLSPGTIANPYPCD